MDRISTATAVADLFGPGKPGFRDGNKALGILPTDLNAQLFNSIQEELMNVIEGAGLVADDADFTQLRQAIQAMIINGQKSVIIHDAVFEASVADEDVVYWHAGNGEFTKAVADGSAAQNAVGFADVTNEKVYAFGAAPIFTGLTPGAYYLDGTTPGAITATPPAANIVKLGLAISATEIYVDIDALGGITQAQADARYLNIGYMLVRDEKTPGTSGGNSTVATVTRALNTVVANTISGASLSANKITLPAGTYRVKWRAPSYGVDESKSMIYNVTDSAYLAYGDSNNGIANMTHWCMGETRFTLASTKEIDLRHYNGTAVTNGLGLAVNIASFTEVYSSIEIIKES